MAKTIEMKNGNYVKIETCGRCPAGSQDGISDIFRGKFARCGFTAYVHEANSLPTGAPDCAKCPLDDYVPKSAEKPIPKEDFESWKTEAREFNTVLQAILCEQKDHIEALEKFQKHIERQMQACLKDLNGGMQPGDTTSLDTRVSTIEKSISEYPLQTLSRRQVAYRAEALDSNAKLIAELAALQEKVKTIDDRCTSYRKY